jgi:Zn-dependent peptidase ImmA (M78 family)
VAGLDSNRGAKRARETRAALGVDPHAPLRCLLSLVEEDLGLPVLVARLHEAMAGACWQDGTATVLWVNGGQPLVRQRFTLAHELGHVRCGHVGVAPDSVATVSGATGAPREVQANAFAAELLFPKAAAAEVVTDKPTLDEVVTLAAHYGVSAAAALFKLISTSRIDAAHAARLRTEIDEGEHLPVYGRLGLAPHDDRLGAITVLPYASPALEASALVAALRGDVPAVAAADAAGVDPGDLLPALSAFGAG